MGLLKKKSSDRKFVAGREPWKFKPSFHIGVGKALLIWFLIISFIPLATVSYINYLNAFKGLTIVAEKSLVTTSNLRVEYINTFFNKVLNSLELQANLESNVDFIEKLTEDFQQSDMTPKQYIESASWKRMSRNKRNELNKIRNTRKFYDIVFIDAKGNILFSLEQDKDLGTNIYNSQYTSTRFAKTARQVLNDGETRFSDIEEYPPSGNKITGMFGKIITRPDGERIGMIAIQIRMDELNKIIQEDVGLGETGVAYLIGEDLLMRSSTRFENDSVILSKRIDHDHAMNWLRYRKLGFYNDNFSRSDTSNVASEKVKSYATTDGTWVYGIYRNIDVLKNLGVNWAIIEEIDLYEAFAYTRKLLNTVIVSLIITAVIVFFLAIFVTSRFVTPLKRLSAWAKEVSKGELIEKDMRVPKNEVGEMVGSFNNLVKRLEGVAEVSQLMAKGDFTRTVDVRSENDVMAKSMNQMIESFKSVIRQANTIAQGDYSTNVVPRSEKDTLGVALYEMTKTLRENALEINNQDWLKSGLAELNDRMSGKKDIEELTGEIITYLVKYTKSDIGLLYLKQNELSLRLIADYAFYDRYNKFSEIHYGEGLIGQVAKQGESLEYKGGKEDPKLNTGIEEQSPGNYIIYPIIYEEKLIGVMQLGSKDTYTDLQKTFLETGMENIGIAINSAQAHTRLQQLLKQTQDQKEKLQVQQEELRQTNEELAGQTKALKVSEETLQNQKEELSVINEELEERTKALERERDNVNRKNEQLKLAQKEVEKKAHDLEIASKYKSEFLANMSHELRTPLNSILVLSQVLIDNKDSNLKDKQIEYAKTMNSSGSDLLNLINEILDLSKIESGKIEIHKDSIDLNQFKDEIERSFKPVTTSKNLKFNIKLNDKISRKIESDSQRLQQIVRNLLSNAVKFTDKGSITLSIFNPGKEVTFTNKTLNGKKVLGFSVTDTGIGISKDKQEVIFDAFQQGDGTTSRKFGGTGLGLTISRSFAKLLGGEIKLESELGKGTTFILFIPEKLPGKDEQSKPDHDLILKNTNNEAKPIAKKPEKNEKPSPEADVKQTDINDDRRNIREGDRFILIIENDSKLIRNIYDEAKSKKFKCMIAGDGETGIHYADYYKPNAVILNTELPGISGWDVIKRLMVNPQTMHIPVHLLV